MNKSKHELLQRNLIISYLKSFIFYSILKYIGIQKTLACNNQYKN